MLTNKHLQDLLPKALAKIEDKKLERPDLILSAWKQIIEEKWVPLTTAISFEKGTLMVKVKNATLYSVLVQQEKQNLLAKLRKKFPHVEFKNIIFRIGI